MSQTQVRAGLVELFTRKIPVKKDGNKQVYWNGEDNLYPNTIERVVLSSPTGKRAADLVAKYISGRGVLDENGNIADYKSLPFVNKRKAYKITDILRMASIDQAKQSGVWFHVGYSLEENGETVQPKQASIDVLPYIKCRKGKDDDDQNPGKIYFKDYEDKGQIGGKKKEDKWFYPYNPDAKVVIAQIKADAGKGKDEPLSAEDILKYKGQVYYMNLTPEYQYALSRFDSVFNDMDTEYRIGLYANTQSRTGFLGKTMFISQGLDEGQAKAEQEDISEFLGAEDSGNVYYKCVEHAEDITKVLHAIQLKPQFDDKLFETTQRRVIKNILGAANNIPEPLIYSAEGALFGTNADTYSEMKMFFSEQTQQDRMTLQNTLEYLGFPCVIAPIVDERVADVSDKQADAQAALKGSVGGVTALIQLQTAVSQGYASRSAAITIIETIYGIEPEVAAKMIGDPVETQPETNELSK